MYISGLINESGRRNKWTVRVSASVLAKCCMERMGHHIARLEWWAGERDKADLAVRASLTLQSLEHYGGSRLSAKLDSSMADRMSECQAKVASHQREVDRFRAFKAMFDLMVDSGSHGDCEAPAPGMGVPTKYDREVDLNADDILYFNLNGADSGREDGDSEWVKTE